MSNLNMYQEMQRILYKIYHHSLKTQHKEYCD